MALYLTQFTRYLVIVLYADNISFREASERTEFTLQSETQVKVAMIATRRSHLQIKSIRTSGRIRTYRYSIREPVVVRSGPQNIGYEGGGGGHDSRTPALGTTALPELYKS